MTFLRSWTLILAAGGLLTAAEPAHPALPLKFLGDAPASAWIPSGYMGDHEAITMDAACKDQPNSGPTCTKVTYAKGDGWGGVVWQHPANDWGEAAGGFDLTGATKLGFWVRGAQGGEKVKFGFGVIGSDKPFSDTAKGELEVTLSKEWTFYSIPVAGQDLHRVKTGFMWVVAGQGDPVTFYLDDATWQ